MINLVVSCNYKMNELINTTGDYNITNGIEKMLPYLSNYKIINSKEYFDKISISFTELCNYIGSDIKCIISIQSFVLHQNLPFDIKIYQFIVDIHGWREYIEECSKYNNLYLLTPYAYSYNIFNYKLKTKIFYLPHCVNNTVEFNTNPKKKILISGRGVKNYTRYPMRVKMFQLSMKNNNLEYFKPDHPYRVNINEIYNVTCGHKFINLLNSYLVCFCDDLISCSPYIVCKFFEIMTSGSLLLASLSNSKKYFDNLGFIENEDYILLNENNMIEKINYVLDENNIDEINKIRYNGYIKANKYHNSEFRAKQLNEIILDTENIKKYIDGIQNTEYYMVTNFKV